MELANSPSTELYPRERGEHYYTEFADEDFDYWARDCFIPVANCGKTVSPVLHTRCNFQSSYPTADFLVSQESQQFLLLLVLRYQRYVSLHWTRSGVRVVLRQASTRKNRDTRQIPDG